ncbi:MAG: aldose 1-epimerase family protein [Gemmiger sp.]|nr:aldose 1-epimerase family protein [Gemmiger sp.]
MEMEAAQFTIENEALRLTVAAHGAEPVSVVDKATGAEMLWQADPAVWNRHAPILFPYTGKLTEGKMIAKGKEYPGGQHGFARDMEHCLAEKTDTTLTLVLAADEKTKALWPYDFVLRSHFVLEGRTVHHTLTVENPTEPLLRFGIGYHPAFVIPFDDAHTTADYELRFAGEESPLCVSALPHGLLSGKSYFLARNTESIPLSDHLFDADSHCMVNLQSKTLALVEKDTGRQVRCDIAGYPYVLLWSAPSTPLKFICIEPWHSLPGEEGGPLEWEHRPCTASLHPGESWQTTLSTTFER